MTRYGPTSPFMSLRPDEEGRVRRRLSSPKTNRGTRLFPLGPNSYLYTLNKNLLSPQWDYTGRRCPRTSVCADGGREIRCNISSIVDECVTYVKIMWTSFRETVSMWYSDPFSQSKKRCVSK